MICPFCRAENIEGADQCVNCGQDLAGLDLPGAGKGTAAPEFVHETIARLPKHDAPQVGGSYPVSLAVRLMQTTGASCVLVSRDGELVGIITGADILAKVAGLKEDLNAITCEQIMTPDPFCLHDDDSIAVALNAMASGGFRHIPIMRVDKPMSLIDVNDVFRFISPNLV
ncbi:MAG TPA: CBS domain-containing protein [Dehalococcoidia bacterium]|nr:CBS domain-containing protein [Dehalococcoidia bacterium]